MKKYKSLIISVAICLLPILLGLAVYSMLPEKIAIHFDMNGTPDNFAPKAFAVFGLPAMMAFFQVIACLSADYRKNNAPAMYVKITKAIIPFVTVVMYIVTLGYALGGRIDIRKVVCFIAGLIICVSGNYIPKLNGKMTFGWYLHNLVSERRILRIYGFGMVICGFLIILSIFLPAVCSAAAVILMIVFCVVMTVYGLLKRVR